MLEKKIRSELNESLQENELWDELIEFIAKIVRDQKNPL